MNRRTQVIGLALTAAVSGVSPAQAQGAEATYWVYVAAESADLVHLVRFGPGGAEVARTIPVGESPVETEGPHGLRLSPDGRYWYMTTGHGIPDGKLWKYATGADTLVADPILLGYFPATLDVTPDGLYAFVVNFNLHGEHVPSSVSVVYTPSMTEVTQTTTCTMPHGARINAAGDKLYSACMMDDQIVEISTLSFEVERRFDVTKGEEGPITDSDAMMAGHADHEMNGDRALMPPASCSPTWALPSAGREVVYVACNRGDEILEIDVEGWTLNRKFQAGRGPYNLALTPDGRTLIATLKQGAAVQFFDVTAGTSRGIVATSTTVTHGVEVSSDGRYAFVSVEGVGAEPGKVDVIDIETLERVASAGIGQQAGGIAFWKMEPAGS